MRENEVKPFNTKETTNDVVKFHKVGLSVAIVSPVTLLQNKTEFFTIACTVARC